MSARLWLRDLRLIVSTTIRGLTNDPLQFIVQAARRLRIARSPRSQSPTVRNAYAWFLADRPDVAAGIVAELRGARGLRRRLARRLGVQLGVVRADHTDSPRVQWLDRQQVGDLTGALATVPASSGQARRIRSELRTLQPGPMTEPARMAEQRRDEVAARRGDHQPPQEPTHRPLFVLTNSLPYTRSGYTQRSHSILTALRAAGARVEATTRIGYPTVVGIPGRPAVTEVDGIPYHRLPTAHLPLELDERILEQRRLLRELAKELRPTVLHCTTDYTNALVTRGLAADLGLPWVYEMRGQLEETWVASRPEPLRAEAADSERVRLLRAKEAELAVDADAVIVLSEVQARDLTERGVPRERIRVVPNAVDESLLQRRSAPEEARTALGLPAEGFWVGSVSSLVDYEGFDVLLRAVRRCRDAGLDVRCALVGDGVSRRGLEGLAEELGLADVVRFPGRVGRDEALRWHEALDLFTVPRRDIRVTRMVTPLKPIEAMALGRPVVASALPALEELVEAPGSGLTFRAGDDADLALRIGQFHDDDALRQRCAGRGRRFASARTWQNAARSILEMYGEECGVEVR